MSVFTAVNRLNQPNSYGNTEHVETGESNETISFMKWHTCEVDWTTVSISDLDSRLIVYSWKPHTGTRLKFNQTDLHFWLQSNTHISKDNLCFIFHHNHKTEYSSSAQKNEGTCAKLKYSRNIPYAYCSFKYVKHAVPTMHWETLNHMTSLHYLFNEHKFCPVIIPGQKLRSHCIFNVIYVKCLNIWQADHSSHWKWKTERSVLWDAIYILHILARSYQFLMHTEKSLIAHIKLKE